VLVDSGAWHRTATVDAELNVLADLGHPVSRKGSYAVYLGSGEFPSKLRVLQADQIEPGTVGRVRLYLNRPAPLLPGDRFILRESGRDETVGGGQLLDVDPILPATKANPDRSIERVVAERGWVDADQLTRLTGQRRTADVGRWVVDPAALVAAKAYVLAQVEEAGALGLDVAGFDERQRAVLAVLDEELGTLTVEAGRVTLGQAPDPLADHPWVADLAAEPFAPPGPDGVERAEVRELVRHGHVVEHDGVYFARSAVDQAIALVRDALEAQPAGVTVAEVRDLLGTSRKYVLALLAHFDGNAITRRRDDVRIAGPRMPKTAPGEPSDS
jgi:selenocysteine-specific elongation factor